MARKTSPAPTVPAGPADTDEPLDHFVGPVRQAAREMVRELGFMAGHYQGQTTFAQCHALLEVERAGRLTASELADLLNVDRSCASRTLNQLIERGWARSEDDPNDGRRKPVSLTPAGRKQLKAINDRANTQVEEALDLMRPEERRAALEGLQLYARALQRRRRRGEYGIRPIRRTDNAAAAAIIRQVMTEHGASGPGFSIHDPEVNDMYGAYRGDRAGYFVLEHEPTGRIVGVAGFAQLDGGDDDQVCELKKMYYLPEVRGLALGAWMMQVVLRDAARAGYGLCYLETLESMVSARRLYESFGFRPIDGPLGCTGHTSCDAWYTLDLAGWRTSE